MYLDLISFINNGIETLSRAERNTTNSNVYAMFCLSARLNLIPTSRAIVIVHKKCTQPEHRGDECRYFVVAMQVLCLN